MRLAAHYEPYQRSPERYRNLTKSIFLRLDPYEDLYARVEFLEDDEVAIDLMRREPDAETEESPEKRFVQIHNGSSHRIMSLDKDKALYITIARTEGDSPLVRHSLERLQEALVEELIM
jgi:hypothetical protein